MIKKKVWKIKKSNKEYEKFLAKELKISTLLAKLLINRGYENPEKAMDFLNPQLSKLSASFDIPGIKEAVNEIKDAVTNKKRIVVYGDYDVDGITSTVLLFDALKKLGAEVSYYIPNRLNEGYGLNFQAIEKLFSEKNELIITVDCGISSKLEVEKGQELGLNFIITDHHQVPEKLPNCTIVNPAIEKADKPWSCLSGVGVAFMLVQALFEVFYGEQKGKELAWEYLDLAALGTIADIVPLVDDNRIIVKNGLKKIAEGKRQGIKALCKVSGVMLVDINADSIAFGIAPRLNACGRLGNTELGVKLLLTLSASEADKIAKELNRENERRQQIEAKILKDVLEAIEKSELQKKNIIVLAAENWHQGVLGIVASRLIEKYYKPVIILSLQNGIYKGSARSIPGFHIYKALSACANLLEGYGGHSQAAGLSIKKDNLENFKNKLSQLAFELINEEDLYPSLELEYEINLAEVNESIFAEICRLEPFGASNPKPVLVYRRSNIEYSREVGSNGGHLKIKLKVQDKLWDGIGFNMAELKEIAATKEPLDIAFVLEKNYWNGKTTLQLQIKDLKQYTQADNPYKKMNFLERIYRNGNQYINNQNFLELPSIQETSTNKVFKDKLKVIEARNCPNKYKYLKNIIKTDENVIVYVNFKETVFNIAADLKRDIPLFGDKIIYYHSGLCFEDKQEIISLVKKNQFKVIITDFSLTERLANFHNIIFYELCNTKDLFYSLLNQFCFQNNNPKLHLIYGEIDKKNIEELIQGIAPNRQQLGQFYIVLKKIQENNKKSSLSISDDQLAEWAKTYSIQGIKKENVFLWLKILEEINLLTQENSNGKREISLVPNPSKVNLEASKHYKQGLFLRKSFSELLSIAFAKI